MTVKGPQVEIIEEKGPDLSRRLKVVMVMLIVIGILGIGSSIATVTSSFSIKDLEERSPNDASTFSLWVMDAETGRPIENVQVTLGDGDHNITGATDQEGLVVFTRVKAGPVDVILSVEGYKTTTGEIVIMKGSPNVIDVPLERGSPSEEVSMLTTQFRSEKYTTSYTNLMAAVMFISSLMAGIGAYLVYRKEFYTIAVITAFLSIFSFGFLIGSLLSLISLILLINSYNGFSHNYHLRMLLETQGREDLKKLFKSNTGPPPGLPPVKRP
ncbi:MAG: carboxypeptidase-like regulatory domain-containing protein [Candidatus Thermoplasmatota archaeon]|nr:carboxypeptidase-like regulatory domain-containing protein [Candidatus Thermoplasmatota archaeon]